MQVSGSLECPVGLVPMNQGITATECGHSIDETSLQHVGAKVERELPNHVPLAKEINCPICRMPVQNYVKSWAIRGAVAEQTHLCHTKQTEEKSATTPTTQTYSPPKGSFKDRFINVVGQFFGGLLGIAFSSYIAFASTPGKASGGGWFTPVKYDYSNRAENTVVAFYASIAGVLCVLAGPWLLKQAMEQCLSSQEKGVKDP